MASPNMNSISRQDVTTLLRQVQGNSLFNRQLSSVCQVNGLKSTGVKAELQRRIVHLCAYSTTTVKAALRVAYADPASSAVINETFANNDVARFHQVRQSIYNASAQRASPSKAATARSNGSVAAQPIPNLSTPSGSPYGTTGYPGRPYGQVSANGISSPYGSAMYGFSFKPSPFYSVESAVSGLLMTQHRNTVTIPLRLADHPILQRCSDDKSYRIMVFCANDDSGLQDVAFPHQSELRVNGDEIKANLRGLKNKPGSTRPVDITNALRLRSNYMNNIEFTYALTNKLQEQGPQWLCPICNKSAPFDQLAVDGYVKAILEKTSKNLETVTIEPNGKWSSKPPKEDSSPSRPRGAPVEDDEDDDLEVSEIIIGGRRLETPKKLSHCTDTPSSGGRDHSSTAPRGSHSAKRPAPAVIDLTLSSDDEEPIQRPSKRQHTYTYHRGTTPPFLSESPVNYQP
ncbi:hypothetical protein TGAM01_v209444 [Trichoderma gamsii]|uniref:PINIT domain-containing protein n=1 Tax=Trichoderma gamsii TaxID=398673 RepID=A0A2P4ZBQ9_9HYPO|nr:hypothetical protein TGAM01_v209444 [Trichoderma gamsii]PON21706.1 hypothetical protein TGAM01_v209444 [Trichoderma gamsii]